MNDVLKEARKKVRVKKWFYWHLVIYLIAFSVIFILTGRRFFDSYDAPVHFFIPWGIVLLFHFIRFKILSVDWESRELEKEVVKIQKRKQLLLDKNEGLMNLNINPKDYERITEWQDKKHQID